MKYYILLFSFLFCASFAFAQTNDSAFVKKDSLAKPLKLPAKHIKRMEFNFIINRSILLGGITDTLAPINNFSSGSTLIAAAYNFNVNSKWALHIQTGISAYKLNFGLSPKKTFPDTLTDYNKQMLRFMGAQLPIGVVYTLKRSKGKDSTRIFYVEGGTYFGINLPPTYKLKYALSKYKQSFYLDNWNPIQVGLYGRLGWKFLAFYASYRFTNIFGSGSSRQDIPKPARLEVGFSIVL